MASEGPRVAVAACFVLFISLIPSAAIGDEGQIAQSLDGEWNFTIAFDPEEDDWDTITVPGNWDATEKYAKHSGNGWYRRSFVPDAALRDKHVRLRFEAIYHESEVFLNRERLGRHVGGYTPFEFDVTDKLKFGEENTISVRADNSYQRGAWWPWRGISRSVNLIANNELRLEWQHIRSEPDLKTGSAKLWIRYRVVNDGDHDADFRIVSRLDAPAIEVASVSGTVAAGKIVEVDATAELTKDQVRLWHFDRPTDNPVTKQWLKEMIHRDFNHPCIVGWSVGNEMRDYRPYAISMMNYVRKELDPHRLVNFVADRTIRTGIDEPIEEGDIAMINAYDRWGFWMNFAAERFPNKPIFMSEFGLKQMQPDGHFRRILFANGKS